METIRIERDQLTKTRYFGHLTLSKQVSPQRVILNLVSRTKEDAIKELVQAVPSTTKIHDKEELIRRVLNENKLKLQVLEKELLFPMPALML